MRLKVGSTEAVSEKIPDPAEAEQVKTTCTDSPVICISVSCEQKKEQLGLQKLPRVKELNAEYAQLLEQKRAAYPAYRKARTEMQEYLVAQKVAAVLLEKEKEQAAMEERRKEEQHTDQRR